MEKKYSAVFLLFLFLMATEFIVGIMARFQIPFVFELTRNIIFVIFYNAAIYGNYIGIFKTDPLVMIIFYVVMLISVFMLIFIIFKRDFLRFKMASTVGNVRIIGIDKTDTRKTIEELFVNIIIIIICVLNISILIISLPLLFITGLTIVYKFTGEEKFKIETETISYSSRNEKIKRAVLVSILFVFMFLSFFQTWFKNTEYDNSPSFLIERIIQGEYNPSVTQYYVDVSMILIIFAFFSFVIRMLKKSLFRGIYYFIPEVIFAFSLIVLIIMNVFSMGQLQPIPVLFFIIPDIMLFIGRDVFMVDLK